MPSGVAVQQGKEYQLSLYARGQGPVTVSLEKQDGKVLASHEVGGIGEDLRAYAGRKDWKDYTLTLKARKLGGAEGFLVIFAAPDKHGKSWWNIGGWGNSAYSLEIRDVEHERVPGRIENGRWYDIKVELKGQAIRCYLDGKRVHEVSMPGVKSMYAVAGRSGNDVILKVVNAASASAETTIDMRGVSKLAATAAVTVLTSASGDDENSFDEPTKVAPKEMTIPGITPSFRYTFSANSVTILRVQAGEMDRY